MRYGIAITALLALGSSADAAAISDRASSGGWGLASILSAFGISVSNDAGKHGPTFSINYNAHGNGVGAWQKAVSHSIPWRNNFQGWSTYKANGVNLGSWLEVEQGNTPNVIPSQYPDEWTFCSAVGKGACGPVLENHYRTWFTTSDIDNFARYGINTIRIPTTYAAWYAVPGSQLYTGNQLAYLRTITNYALSKGMHVIIGLHSLPGGANSLDIGEALGHGNWWYNQTNFDFSMKVVDQVLGFIQTTINPNQITFEPANEPCDDIRNFATPNTISYPNGVNYYNTYLRAVYAKIQKVNRNIPMMISDAFMGASYWAPFWQQGQNIVFDSHFYFFAASGVYSQFVSDITCGQASAAATSFPVFVGEFSIESKYNNTLAARRQIYQSQQYAYAQYLSGSAFWDGKLDVTDRVDGEGTKNDYWSFANLIKDGVVLPGGAINSSFC
ncbi:hypothetical protein IAR55_006804 [Kwoniella newhampshirensis]|uniref:glucan 1,3-beta-glucosidase n=1 Tax=Kwoniella newhampshirensis TaxID=1651941 RepID=A0AAW0YTB2_9TREE